MPDLIRPPTRGSAWSSPIPTSSAGQRKNFLKPSAPSEFNGDRSVGKAFLTSCRTYIRLCPESFEDDLTKVIWAMSYMKAGRAGCWATREFEHEAKSGHLCFIDWADFKDEFRKDFMPLDSEAAAVNVLETTSYFQGRWSVDDYLDQFKDLIEDSSYSDPKMIVVKFHRGLDRQISTALAGMTYGRPADTDPEAWFCLAIRMDQNRADEAFHTSHRQPNLPTPSISRIPMAPQPAQAAPVAHFAHSNLSLGNPVLMDIDVTRKAKATPNTCRRCRKTGHWAKDCDLQFDVRYMDADELETELENKLAAKDVASMETSEEAEPPVSVEDFVSRSG